MLATIEFIEKKVNKYCIIIPYFGKWPSYFNLYLRSCDNVSNIDIHFVTDLETPTDVPSNVFFHKKTFLSLKSAFEEKLGFDIALEKPFKLCDFRPAYGYLFEEIVKDYGFWGWGDIDLLYGNIYRFIEEDLMDADVISMREKWLSGSFALLKNSKVINQAFLSSPDYKKIFSDHNSYAFDECGPNWLVMRKAESFLDLKLENDSMTMILRRLERDGLAKLSFKNRIKEFIAKGDFVRWGLERVEDGKGKEYAYYHFISEKRYYYFQYPNWKSAPSQIFINRTGFYPVTQIKFQTIIKLLEEK